MILRDKEDHAKITKAGTFKKSIFLKYFICKGYLRFAGLLVFQTCSM